MSARGQGWLQSETLKAKVIEKAVLMMIDGHHRTPVSAIREAQENVVPLNSRYRDSTLYNMMTATGLRALVLSEKAKFESSRRQPGEPKVEVKRTKLQTSAEPSFLDLVNSTPNRVVDNGGTITVRPKNVEIKAEANQPVNVRALETQGKEILNFVVEEFSKALNEKLSQVVAGFSENLKATLNHEAARVMEQWKTQISEANKKLSSIRPQVLVVGLHPRQHEDILKNYEDLFEFHVIGHDRDKEIPISVPKFKYVISTRSWSNDSVKKTLRAHPCCIEVQNGNELIAAMDQVLDRVTQSLTL